MLGRNEPTCVVIFVGYLASAAGGLLGWTSNGSTVQEAFGYCTVQESRALDKESEDTRRKKKKSSVLAEFCYYNMKKYTRD